MDEVIKTDSAVSEEEAKASEVTEEAAASTSSEEAEAVETAPEKSEEQVKADEAEAKDQEEKKEKKRKRKELYVAREGEARERDRADTLERELAERKAKEKPQARPNRDDFESDEEYEDALVDHRLDLRKVADTKKSSADQEAKALADNRVKYNAGIADAEEKYDDFDEVAGEAGEVIGRDAFLANQIKASDLAHDIVYYLGKQPEEARRISALSESGQLKALGKLEAQLSVELKQKIIPGAINPGKELAGAGVGGVAGKKETTSEFIARRNAEEEAQMEAGTFRG